MSDDGFSANWLRQREPFDLAARSLALTHGFRDALRARHVASPAPHPWRLIDLAAGAGANFRALAPVLATDQDWLLIDHDPLLLDAQFTEISAWADRRGWRCQTEDDATHGQDEKTDDRPAGPDSAIMNRMLHIDTGQAHWRVRGRRLDLARGLEAIDLTHCDGLVTTAFLDLVSPAWLDRLCALLARHPRPLLATLTVDGRRDWQPAHPADGLITKAFLSHQGGDKGFGASLGVHATAHLADGLAARGWRVRTEASDWRIGPDHHGMLLALAREAAAVALSTASARTTEVSGWLAARSAGIDQGRVSLAIGHLDLLAVPAS